MENNTKIPSIVRLLAYYEIFGFPLTLKELETNIPRKQIVDHLKDLLNSRIVFQKDDYYAINPQTLEKNIRIGCENRVKKFMEKGIQRAQFIGKFPFVRAVMISGSLSKGYMKEDGDIDFFIITSSNRLWIARTLLILYKKIFLLNSRKYFCVNYFIGENNLEIHQKNIFTATEITTLIPIVNPLLYDKFIKSNSWISNHYPKFNQKEVKFHLKNDGFKRVLESTFKGSFGNYIDINFMKLTFKRWQKKFSYLEPKDFDIALETRRNVSKHHPSHFQKKVLSDYSKIMNNLLNKIHEKNSI